MRLDLRRGALLLAAALVAGCSYLAPAAMPAVGGGRSPAALRNPAALLYVSEYAADRILMYSYPGLKPLGEIDHVHRPTGMCVDARTQDVWVVESAFANRVVEFAHGGTSPIKTLHLGKALFPDACAVDPNGGTLAVVSTVDGDDPGEVDVFASGSRAPAVYQIRRMFLYAFATYDDSDNLFVDGADDGFRLAELASGASALKIVPTSLPRIRNPGNVAFDGTGLAIGDEKRGVVYRLWGTQVGKTVLRGTCFVQQFFIDANRVVAPNICGSKGEIAIYDYPAGGAPVAKITGLLSPFGTVVSR